MKRIVDLMALPLLLVTAATAAPLQDKTLVAWVGLDNVHQRGGSVLTLIDPAERFDAIVFGEVAEGKWMAGSDFFRRTQQDQASWPAESASSNVLVQIAVCYGDNRITLFRNGKEYATYAMGQAQPFGDEAMVLLGLRYIGEMGEIGFFAGAIEEARIYDTALDAAQLAALAPNVASIPNPLACWTFEDGKADDVMKRFPATRLEGRAHVAAGRLILDGGSYLWAAKDARAFESEPVDVPAFDASGQTLFYKARSPRTGNMWDTWLYLQDGNYHLYYLANCRGQWDNISLARSPDGVHWTEHGRILSKGRGVTWMGTGSTWKSPAFDRDGKFFMNFSEWRGPRQAIHFAESKDLVHWTRLGSEYEFVQDERWYEKNGRWDCIWTLPRPGGGLYGYWTATPKTETGGRFGFGETLDGITWKALPPPKVSGAGEGEVGAIERIGDKYYMMFGIGGSMMTLVAERPEGPFAAAKKNRQLLAGHTYFARFFPTPDGLLVNHHSIARGGQVSFGTLKAAQLDEEGTLRLRWWPGNEKMKNEALEVKQPSPRLAETQVVAMLETMFDAGRGLVLEGTLKLPAPGATKPVGLFLSQGPDSGTAILVHAGGVTELGPMRADGSGFKAEQRVNREWAFPAAARFRLVLKGSLVEFYLDDLLMQCYSLPQAATGRIGLLQARDPGAITALQAWLPENPKPGPAAMIAAQAGPAVLKPETFRPHVEAFNRSDRETVTNHIPNATAWDWMAKNVPLFECPDKDLEEIYYFRWWTFRKHIKQTPDGFIVTEFLPPVPWSGKHNSINCPAGHHFYEGRWLHDPRYLDDYAAFWFRKGGEPRKYSFWAADSIYARSLVLGDERLPGQLLPDLMANYEAWEKSHRDGSGLFWQNDGNDGMEVSIGGSGCRATINSYQYGDAMAIARIAGQDGQPELARTWRAKAETLRQLVQEKLWDKDALFFKVLPRGKGALADVRELHGFTPWYFNLPDPDKSVAWKQLMDPDGFYAPFGPTTAEQRHPRFAVAYQGHECQWNGPSWPLATAVTLTAMANLLNHYAQDAVGKADYWKTFQCYLRSHRFRQLPPETSPPKSGLTRSFDNTVARHTWWAQERLGGTEWVQYEFQAPVRIEAVEVFWYDDPQGIDPPSAWRLLARDGAEWREVQVMTPCGTATDRYNRVEFTPVHTTALRLEARTAPGLSAGILEWRVIQQGANVAATAVPSASYSDIYAARLSALNDGDSRMEHLETRQPWIDENLNPYNGDWIARTLLKQRRQPPDERGKDYNHSTFCDLVISGLVGLRPRADDTIEVNPLVPEGTWDYFCLDHVRYHGRNITIIYDKSGQRYGRGKGLQVLADGLRIAGSDSLQRVEGRLPAQEGK